MMNSKQPLISVIIPVYNVEEYLRQCLDSVAAQTYRNLQIILIDDGSTDNSGSICDGYAASDSRMTVIHTANKGLSAARNAGLDIAKGEYITFVDSDDTVAPEYVSTLYDLLIEYKATISMATSDRLGSLKKKWLAPHTIACSGFEAAKSMLYQSFIDSSSCYKLYKKHIFSNHRFKEGIIYEDLDLILSIIPDIDKVVWANKAIYKYNMRSNSTTGTFKLKRLDVLDVTDRIEAEAKAKWPDLLPAARDRKLSANFNMFVLLVGNGYAKSVHADRCWHNIKSLRKSSLLNRHVRLKNKLGILASIPGRHFLEIVAKISLLGN